MTIEQMQTLAAHIRANTDPDVVAALAIRNDVLMAELYNTSSSFIVWKTAVMPEEYREAIVWTEVDGLTAGKARIWEWVTQNMTAAINASSANVRQGLADCWAANSVTRGQMLAIAKRAASLAESIFATGDGTTAVPGTLVYEGSVPVDTISISLNRY